MSFFLDGDLFDVTFGLLGVLFSNLSVNAPSKNVWERKIRKISLCQFIIVIVQVEEQSLKDPVRHEFY